MRPWSRIAANRLRPQPRKQCQSTMTEPKILLIEDDETMRTLLRTLMHYEGFEVAQLEDDDNLDVMMDTVQREKPALILLDVYLRQVSGFDLLQRIRQDDELKGTRVIMSSGLDFKARCQDEGADGFLLKPYMPDELIGKIRQVIEDSH